MNKKGEKMLIVATCFATALISAAFSLSQGDLKAGKNKTNNSYISQAETKEEDITRLYKIVNTTESGEDTIVNAYQNEELDDEQIICLVNDIKKENNVSDGFKINLYENEESLNNDESPIFVIEVEDEKAYITKTYKNVEHNIVDEPEYELISYEDVEDEYDFDSLKTMVYVVINENDNEEMALTNVKSVGNVMRGIIDTQDILNVIAYTSDDKDEYWEYNGHNKDNIVYGRILDIN